MSLLSAFDELCGAILIVPSCLIKVVVRLMLDRVWAPPQAAVPLPARGAPLEVAAELACAPVSFAATDACVCGACTVEIAACRGCVG